MTQDAPLHASCVAVGDQAVLIIGASGAGKSTLALELLALGGVLVADDRVILTAKGAALIAQAPATVAGLIEARGVGVLNAAYQDTARVTLVIDLDTKEPDRIPIRRQVTILGCDIPLLYRSKSIHLAPAILQWMRAGRSER